MGGYDQVILDVLKLKSYPYSVKFSLAPTGSNAEALRAFILRATLLRGKEGVRRGALRFFDFVSCRFGNSN